MLRCGGVYERKASSLVLFFLAVFLAVLVDPVTSSLSAPTNINAEGEGAAVPRGEIITRGKETEDAVVIDIDANHDALRREYRDQRGLRGLLTEPEEGSIYYLEAEGDVFKIIARRWDMLLVPPPTSNSYGPIDVTNPTEDVNPSLGQPVSALNDGKTQKSGDDEDNSVHFGVRDEPNRVLYDLRESIDVKSVTSYSWHILTRANQKYALYYYDGETAPDAGSDVPSDELEGKGWTKLINVFTRWPRDTESQVGVCLMDMAGGPLMKARYILFDMLIPYTFWTELDVYKFESD